MRATSTKEQIIETADRLFYQHGYEATSFTDIAAEVGISRGNFYYHFKTKDEILDAVIQRRITNTGLMLDNWEAQADTPADRILSFVNILIMNRSNIKHYGCPVGTLCSELAKLNHTAQQQANQLFTLFRLWLRKQFTLLGYRKDADKLAMHVLARSQGIATLANAFHDEKFIHQEVKLLQDWLQPYLVEQQ